MATMIPNSEKKAANTAAYWTGLIGNPSYRQR
jgi:hypothetical protein